MTIKELLEVSKRIVQLTITIRENGCGLYIYRYDIAPHIKVYQSYPNERYKLEPKERLDLKRRDPVYPSPTTFWAIDPKDAKEVHDLEIAEVFFTPASYPWLYKENSMRMATRADITAYPKGWAKPIEVAENNNIAGQMDITDFLGSKT